VKLLGTKVPCDLMLRVLDCIVTISLGVYLVLWLFYLFRNVWVCICVCFVTCVCFGNMCTYIYCFCSFCTVILLFRLGVFCSYLFCLY
jgi:hypothetical protein